MAEEALVYEPGDHVFTRGQDGWVREYHVREDGALDYQFPRHPVKASTMPVGTVVHSGPMENGRLVFRAHDGWFLVHTRERVDPAEEFRGGWDVFTPDRAVQL